MKIFFALQMEDKSLQLIAVGSFRVQDYLEGRDLRRAKRTQLPLGNLWVFAYVLDYA